MNKLKIPRREGRFGKVNLRPENHGDKHVPACDVPVTFAGGKREIDNLIPCEGGKASDILYDKKGNLKMAVLNPHQVHRKPDSLVILIHDAKSPLKFIDASAKDFEIELRPKWACEISTKLQVHPGKGQIERLSALMMEKCDLEIEATQEDLFGEQDNEGGQDDAGDEAQQDLVDDE